MRFLYGQNGLIGFIIDGITYTYHKNLIGNIIGIFSDNTEMATYGYDAWGNCIMRGHGKSPQMYLVVLLEALLCEQTLIEDTGI